MAIGDGLVLDIERLVAGGEGLAFHEGRAIFVPFVLPGEKVRAVLVREQRDWARAELLEVLEASGERVEPECPLFGVCGGCDLQMASYAAQREAKLGILRDALRRGDVLRRGGGAEPFEAALGSGELGFEASEPYGYRNRFQFHFDEAGRLGFKRRSSDEVVAVPFCPIADQSVNDWLAEGFGSSVSAREEMRPFIGGAERFVVYGQGGRVWLEGRHKRAEVEILGDKIGFDPGAFFQSNHGMLGRMVEAALAGIEGGRAADLYAGVGLFGHFLAKRGARVVMVEQNAASLALARKNAAGPVHEWHQRSVDDWCLGPGAGRVFDAVIVDPPRTGLSPALKLWLGKKRPPILSYVSCDPVTLARDTRELLDAGFRLERLTLFDFYPQSGHIECLARFVGD